MKASCSFCQAPTETPLYMGTQGHICRACLGVGVQEALAHAESADAPIPLHADPVDCSLCGQGKQRHTLFVRGESVACPACLLQGATMVFSGSKTPPKSQQKPASPAALLRGFFADDPAQMVTSSRNYSMRMQADLHVALMRLFAEDCQVHKLVGVHGRFNQDSLQFPTLLSEDQYGPQVGPLQYTDMDVGEATPLQCLKQGMWLLEANPSEGEALRYAALLSPKMQYGQPSGVTIEFAAPPGEAGQRQIAAHFKALEDAMQQAQSYRGKVLSFEKGEHHAGMATGIRVHALSQVTREQVILPDATLALLERNVFQFYEQQAALQALQLSTKKGLLFYGPPGTGKTHTIHYLASKLKDHTVFLITAEQIGMLSEYMSMARLLQPSIVVLEDADLLARQREHMNSPCEEVLLNQLLNEMDGLKEDAEILFILTTNRPEALEGALAGRPGRVDQAIEFPLPDATGRGQLLDLYARGLSISGDLKRAMVDRTEGVSAAFIRELMRRVAQICIASRAPKNTANAKTIEIQLADVDAALDEMLFQGGSLNASLLGVAR